jgi:hypothetical protein
MGCGGKNSWLTMKYSFVISTKLQKGHRKLDVRGRIRSQDFLITQQQCCPFYHEVFNTETKERKKGDI